eukprot:gene856-491_t
MPGLDVHEIKETPIWQQMAKVLSHLLSERPGNSLEAVVSTSHYVLHGDAVPPKPGCVYADPRPKATCEIPPDALVNNPLDGEDEEAEEAPAEDEGDDFAMQGELRDVVTEQRFFNAVGVGLNPEEAFRVVVGLKALMRSEPLSSGAFWGVIHGSRGDYYIAEGKIDPARLPEEEEADDEDDDEDEGNPIEGIAQVFFSHAAKKHHSSPKEEPGTGLNENVYYAASSLDPTKWFRLPDVTPQQVSAARLLRNAFTGDLEAPVLSHPRFPGLEKDYLRAQISRITCTCKIAPKDVYTTEGAVPDEEEDDDGNVVPPPAMVPAYQQVPPLIPQEIPDEDDTEAVQPIQVWFTGYPDDELLQGKYWVHVAPTLLRDGRTTVAPPPEGEAEDDGAEPDEPVDNTEVINPFLSDLSKDAPLSFPGHSRPNFNAWTFRKAYQHESSKRGIYLARSMLWPGAMTYAVTERGVPGATFRMLYIGTGLKSLQGVNYFPQLPPKPLFEYVEGDLQLQRDCTVDEELEYAPLPAKPKREEEEEVEEEED